MRGAAAEPEYATHVAHKGFERPCLRHRRSSLTLNDRFRATLTAERQWQLRHQCVARTMCGDHGGLLRGPVNASAANVATGNSKAGKPAAT